MNPSTRRLLAAGPTGLASREEIVRVLCARLNALGRGCSESVVAGLFVAAGVGAIAYTRTEPTA